MQYILTSSLFILASQQATIKKEDPKEGQLIQYVKIGILSFLGAFLLICTSQIVWGKLKKHCRKKTDLEPILAVALARINNVDIKDPEEKIIMGVGGDPQNIDDWVTDIWESYDQDGNHLIDKFEIKTFVAQTLQTAGIVIKYSDEDFDDLFDQMDYMRDGYLSRVEMKHYLRYLADLKPPSKQYIQYLTGKAPEIDDVKSAPVQASNVTEADLIDKSAKKYQERNDKKKKGDTNIERHIKTDLAKKEKKKDKKKEKDIEMSFDGPGQKGDYDWDGIPPRTGTQDFVELNKQKMKANQLAKKQSQIDKDYDKDRNKADKKDKKNKKDKKDKKKKSSKNKLGEDDEEFDDDYIVPKTDVKKKVPEKKFDVSFSDDEDNEVF